MKTPFLAAMLLALSAGLAVAASDDGSISSKAMNDHPGTAGGTTATPTAKPETSSLSYKQMQDQPGVNSDKTGTTADPNAKPVDGSIDSKEMRDNPGARK